MPGVEEGAAQRSRLRRRRQENRGQGAYFDAEGVLLVVVLHTSYPAVPSSVSVARDLVAAVADRAGASQERLESVRLAVSEALTNAVERDEGGEVHVTATVVGGQLAVLVADGGCVRPRMGFGLTLIAACSDHFMVGTTASQGVQVEMRFDLEAAGRASSSASGLLSAV
jgi:anti-sigma regulatory factor (Ser/Thr protein kinase)